MKLSMLCENMRWDAHPNSRQSQISFRDRNKQLRSLRNEAGMALEPIKDGWHRIIADPTDADMQFVQKVDNEIEALSKLDVRFIENEERLLNLGKEIRAYLDARSAAAYAKLAQNKNRI